MTRSSPVLVGSRSLSGDENRPSHIAELPACSGCSEVLTCRCGLLWWHSGHQHFLPAECILHSASILGWFTLIMTIRSSCFFRFRAASLIWLLCCFSFDARLQLLQSCISVASFWSMVRISNATKSIVSALSSRQHELASPCR